MSILRRFDDKLSLLGQKFFRLEICEVLNDKVFVKPISGESFYLENLKFLNHFLIDNFDFRVRSMNLLCDYNFQLVPIVVPKQSIDMEGLEINVSHCMKWYRDNYYDDCYIKNLNINSKLMWLGSYMYFENCELNSNVICTDCEHYWVSSNLDYNQFQLNCKNPFDIINVQKNPQTHTIMIFRNRIYHDDNKLTIVYQKRDCRLNLFPYFKDFKNIKDWRFGFSDLFFDDILMKSYLRECVE